MPIRRVFLNALQEQDLATADLQLDDNLVYQNVGFPTVRGRKRTMKLFKGLQRPSFGFEVKIHRIAVNGPVVLTERTDVLRVGPVRLQFWVCGVLRGQGRPNHLVAGLLRHVRHDQGHCARPHRGGRAGVRPTL